MQLNKKNWYLSNKKGIQKTVEFIIAVTFLFVRVLMFLEGARNGGFRLVFSVGFYEQELSSTFVYTNTCCRI